MTGTIDTYCPKCGRPIVGPASYCASCGTRIFRDSKGEETTDPYLGETIDGIFEVESILGTGSMGIVYKARHRALNCYVALKVLKHDFLSDRVALTRFQREAQAASCLNHPNVIHILHYGKTSLNAPYIAMECLEGDELAVVIPKQFPLDQRRVASIVLQTAKALSAAHAANIIHRDLKPANIVVIPKDGGELVKVLDFGIAKIADVEGEGLTKEGAMCGTPAFMSPEQVLCQKVTPASDLFSLGSIMYYMLTCKLPFNGTSMVEMAQSILNTTPPAPSNRLDTVVDPRLEVICMKALEKSPEKRYQSADEMCRDLEDALQKMGNRAPVAKPKIVVGNACSTDDLDGETNCSIPAMPDEEEGTVVEMKAMDDAEENNHDTLEVFSTTRGGVRGAVGAVGEVFSDVFASSKTVRTLSPDECTVIHESMLDTDTIDEEESKEETLARRKKLMLGLVCITALVCIIGVLILVFISWVTRPAPGGKFDQEIVAADADKDSSKDKPAGSETAEGWNEPPKNEPRLTRDDIEYLSGLTSDKAAKGIALALGYGLPDEEASDEADSKNDAVDAEEVEDESARADREAEKLKAEAEKAEAERLKAEKDEAEKAEAERLKAEKAKAEKAKAEVKKDDTSKKSTSKTATTKTSTKPAAAKTQAKSGSSSATGAAKLQQAIKLEATDKAKACNLYRELAKDPSLSQSDRLKAQSKVRGCGRISI